MTNRFQDAAERLGARLQQRAGRSVTYIQGSTEIPLTSWANVVSYEVIDGESLTFVKAHDWGIVAADLVSGETRITPKDGDRITETLNGSAVTYTVSAVGNRPCYEWQDGAGVTLLVHTKRTT